MNDGMQYRDEDRRDILTRNLSLRAATINEAERSVEATISTAHPVEMYDWMSGGTMDEILLSEAADFPDQIPLLANHSRYSLDDIIGSGRQLKAGKDEITARLHFATDEVSERAWQKVREGHITDVSIGYRVREATQIEPGNTAAVKGKKFTAAKRRLRVATDWAIKEVSLVPVGADKSAKIREEIKQPDKEHKAMSERLRKYLESIGLKADADSAAAWAFLNDLEGDQKDAVRQIMHDEMQGRREQSPPVVPPPVVADTDAIRDAARDEERKRVREIRDMAAADIPRELLNQAIDEGWDAARCSREFLTALRGQRMIQTQSAPAGHATGHEAACNVRSLAAALMIANRLDPTKHGMHDGHRSPRRVDRLSPQDADHGDEFSRMSMVDIVRECARLDTGRIFRDPEEAWRAATSGTSLTRVFTTNIYAQLIAGWDETPDSTGWCQEEEVANFLTNEDITLNASASPELLPRGGTATHATAEDAYETYRIYRYARKFVADEQDMIDDRLGAILNMPREMGMAARRVRPDLVYAELLANGTLTATAGALFNSTAETTAGGHANLTTAVLGAVGLKAAITSMGKKRIGGKTLNIRPRFLIVPVDLQWTGRELLNSAELRDTTANTVFMTMNVLAGENLSLVVDDRLGVAGVTDPETKTAYVGTATNWFLAGDSRTVKVIYRRGTNRQPQLRSFTLDRGQWGMGWDINLDVGCKAVDYRGLHKSTGAG